MSLFDANKKEIIANTLIFSTLSDNQLNILVPLFEEVIAEPSEPIVVQGEPAVAFYIIVSGTAEVLVKDKKNQDQLVAVLNAKDTIGYAENEDIGVPRLCNATVRPQTRLILLAMSNSELIKFVKANPEVATILRDQRQLIERCNFIKLASPFTDLPNYQISQLAHTLITLTVEAKTQIIKQGESGDECYLIEEGQVEITIEETGSDPKVIGSLGPGDIFGELALFEGQPRNATITSTTPCTLLVLARTDFLKILYDNQEVVQKLEHVTKFRNRPKKVEHYSVYKRNNNSGETLYILKNNKTNQYIQLSEEGWFIWEKLDGQHTLKDLIGEFMTQFSRFAPQDITFLIYGLDRVGLIRVPKIHNPHAKLPFHENLLKWTQTVMEAKYTFKNPDKFMTKLYNNGGYLIYTRTVLILLFCLIFSGMTVFIFESDEILKGFASNPHNFTYLLWILPISLFTIPMHELAHALTTKSCGREVHGFGFGWYWVSAIAFCDTSDMWMTTPKNRIKVNIAGIFSDLCFAGIAAWVAFYATNPSVSLIAWLFTATSYLNCIYNLDTLFELDGYYVLEDTLDEPGLRRSSFLWLTEIPKHFRHPKLFIKNYKNVIYWLVCIAYVVLSISAAVFFQNHVLFHFLSDDSNLKSNEWLRYLGPVILIVVVFLTVRLEARRINQR